DRDSGAEVDVAARIEKRPLKQPRARTGENGDFSGGTFRAGGRHLRGVLERRGRINQEVVVEDRLSPSRRTRQGCSRGAWDGIRLPGFGGGASGDGKENRGN